MTDRPQFLTIDGRVGYLYERNYFPAGSFSDAERQRLAGINFHYFLGYARNYRMLVDRGRIDAAENGPAAVFELIDIDHTISTLLYNGLRVAEWNLRRILVEQYSSLFDPYESFLNQEQYTAKYEGSQQNILGRIIGQTLRYGEPFVDTAIDERAAQLGVKRHQRYEPRLHDECIELIRPLPLWAIVDGLSLNTLSRIISDCRAADDGETYLWKRVSTELGLSTSVALGNIDALTVLRNFVAHHSRLWMRPATKTPKKARLFKAALREVDPQGMLVSFLNVALFMPESQRRQFADDLLDAVDSNQTYRYGITRTSHRSTLEISD